MQTVRKTHSSSQTAVSITIMSQPLTRIQRLDESQQTEAKKFLGLGNIVVLDLHYILSGLITLHSYKATNLW